MCSSIILFFRKVYVKIFVKLFKIPPDAFDEDFLFFVYKKRKGLKKNAKSIKVLAMRGSTSDYSFYPEVWEGSYNLGVISEDLYTTYHIYNNIKDDLPNLEYIVLFYHVFIDGFLLSKTTEKYRGIYYNFFFTVPYEVKGVFNQVIDKIIAYKCRKFNSDVRKDYCGYDTKTYYMSLTKSEVEERVNVHLREHVRKPDQLKWLVALNKVINDEGKKLIIVIPPFRSDYKQLLPQDSLYYDRLKELNLRNVDIVDMFNSDMFNDDDFGDTDHLVKSGAIKLTLELKKLFEQKGYL